MNPTQDQYIDIHTHHYKKNEQVFAIQGLLPEHHSAIPAFPAVSMGIHPWYVETWEEKLGIIITNVNNLKCIGEVGLDKACTTPFEVQETILIEQLKLANEYNKPVIIHCVKAYAELIQIKKHEFKDQVWIFHGYSSSLEMANQLMKLNCYLSYGKNLLIEGSKVQQVFKEIPLDLIFFETDNEPDLSIKEVYKVGSVIKQIEINDLKNRIFNNFKSLTRDEL